MTNCNHVVEIQYVTMPNDSIHIDPIQLREILDSIKVEKSGFDWGVVLTMLQSLAIVSIGAWSIFQYYAFQARDQQLTLLQKEFEVRQQELSRQMATILLQKTETETAIAIIEKERKSALPFELDWDLSHTLVEESGEESLFGFKLQASIKNASEKLFSIPYVVFEVFLSPDIKVAMADKTVFAVPPTPTIYELPPFIAESAQHDDFWRIVRTVVYTHEYLTSDHLHLTNVENRKNVIRRSGGEGTIDNLAPGESADTGIYIFIRAKKNTFAGITMNWGFTDGIESKYRFKRQWTRLSGHD